jgi:hypothetical protein
MADDRKTQQAPQEHEPSHDERYLKLLKGEITSKEFVKDLKDQVRRDRAASRSGGYSAARRAAG